VASSAVDVGRMDTISRLHIIRRGLAAILAVALVATLGPGPATADAAVSAPSFEDVAPTSPHAPAIGLMAAAQITLGCAPDRFCPNDRITRAQVASLMARTLSIDPVRLAAFSDVGATSPHSGNINALAARGIVQGCAPASYCPARSMSRAQMATILARAFDLRPTGSHPGFRDARSGVHAPSIQALADAGITVGCGENRFCGADPVTRAQFASLLVGAAEELVVTAANAVKDKGNNNKGGNGKGTTPPVTDPTPPATDPTPPPAEPAPTEPPPPPAEPTPMRTAFAALLSEDELAVQRRRMTTGPFRTAGDFSPNSPGHWNEMAATMKLDFASARWNGPTVLNAAGSVMNMHDLSSSGNSGIANDPPASVRRMAHDMMSAAYAAAITENHAVAAAITKEIEYQATRPRLDYSNRTLWPFNYYSDLNPLFMHAVWVKDYVLAYDITKAMGHSSPTVERWFLNLAELNEQAIGRDIGGVFPNRRTDSYSSRSSWVNQIRNSTVTANGTITDYARGMQIYNNRRSNQAGFYGLVGVVLGNPYYKEEFKRYGREWVMFGHRVTPTDGFTGDVNRGTNDFPQLGFSYGLHAMESLIPAMDGLARQGDTSLYEFSSREGFATSSGGTNHYKTMEDVLDTYIKWIKGSYPAHFTASNGDTSPPSISIAGNPFYRIKSRGSYGHEIINDATLLLPANYYNRADWHQAIMRIGTPTGFTQTPQPVGAIVGWRGDWRHRFLRSLDTDPYPTSP
jgi:hypothetical protein